MAELEESPPGNLGRKCSPGAAYCPQCSQALSSFPSFSRDPDFPHLSLQIPALLVLAHILVGPLDSTEDWRGSYVGVLVSIQLGSKYASIIRAGESESLSKPPWSPRLTLQTPKLPALGIGARNSRLCCSRTRAWLWLMAPPRLSSAPPPLLQSDQGPVQSGPGHHGLWLWTKRPRWPPSLARPQPLHTPVFSCWVHVQSVGFLPELMLLLSFSLSGGHSLPGGSACFYCSGLVPPRKVNGAACRPTGTAWLIDCHGSGDPCLSKGPCSCQLFLPLCFLKFWLVFHRKDKKVYLIKVFLWCAVASSLTQQSPGSCRVSDVQTELCTDGVPRSLKVAL